MPTGIGQKTKSVFNLVSSGVVVPFPECEDGIFDCNFVTPVFADATGFEAQNDKSSILGMFDAFVTGVVFTLQKKVAGSYADQAVFSATYGEIYPQGSFTTKPNYL